MKNGLRLGVSICLLVSSIAQPGQAYDDRYQRPNFQPTLPQTNLVRPFEFQPATPQWFLNDTYLKPDLNLSLLTAKVPQFELPDLNNTSWFYSKDDLQFNEGLLKNFSASINTPQQTKLDFHLSDFSYPKDSKTPLAFKQSYADSFGTTLTRERTNQLSVKNEFAQTYRSYVQKNYPDVANNPFAERPESLSPPPSEELVTSFHEIWTLKSKSGSPQKSSLQIDSMDFANNSYLNKYEGTFTQNNQPIEFKVNLERGSKGEVNSIQVEMWGKNSPVVNASWKKTAGVNPDDSFKQFQDAIPVPLFAGPRSTTDINGVHLSEAPLKLNENGGISLTQIPDPNKLNNIANQSQN